MSNINLPIEAIDGINHIKEVCDRLKPLVAIDCITYNHEPYIRDALEGFVMQKANFQFVAIVHEDASTDNTAEIIREYAEKYSDIILPIYERENQYKTNLGSIMQTAREATGAKYIAYCEGDDYWTDPLKLQKQVDFLESHTDYSMCFNAIEVVNENSGGRYPLAKVENREYQPEEIIESLLLQTASILIRKNVLESKRYKKIKADRRFKSGDINLYLSAAAIGKIYCIADFMSVYRVNQGGATNRMRKDPFLFVNEVKLMNEHFGDLFGRSFKNNLAKGYLRTFLIGVQSFSLNVIFKSLIGLSKYVWFLKPKTLKRSIYHNRSK